MFTWKQYYLKETPFQEAPSIEPTLTNDRLNGKIFSKEGFKKSFDELLSLIHKRKSICYLRSDISSRGTGKSAVLAAVYWDLQSDQKLKKQFLPVWVTVQDYRSMTDMIGRILDTFILSGLVDKVKNKLGDTDPESIRELISEKIAQPSPSVLLALSKILSVPNEELPWKYVNIKRSLPMVGNFELFRYFLHLLSVIEDRRIVVFIDQFEEYVESQITSSAKGLRLANDMKDIYRSTNASENLTFILTLHPATQQYFEDASSEVIRSYGEITENAANLVEIKPHNLVKIAQKYILRYRINNPPKEIDNYYPFTISALEYIAKIAGSNVRTFIRLCHNALMEASYQEVKKIDSRFLTNKENHHKIGLGIIPQ